MNLRTDTDMHTFFFIQARMDESRFVIVSQAQVLILLSNLRRCIRDRDNKPSLPTTTTLTWGSRRPPLGYLRPSPTGNKFRRISLSPDFSGGRWMLRVPVQIWTRLDSDSWGQVRKLPAHINIEYWCDVRSMTANFVILSFHFPEFSRGRVLKWWLMKHPWSTSRVPRWTSMSNWFEVHLELWAIPRQNTAAPAVLHLQLKLTKWIVVS